MTERAEGPGPGAEPVLCEREEQLLVLLGTGSTVRQAAAALGISRSTARSHIASAGRKLGAERTPEILARAITAGALDPGTADGVLDPQEQHLAALIAAGHTVEAIASAAGASSREVREALAAAQAHVGAATPCALVWRAAQIGAFPGPAGAAGRG